MSVKSVELKKSFPRSHTFLYHYKHQGLDSLIRSVSRVTTALSKVSSVFQLVSFLVVCSDMISKRFCLVAFFVSVKPSSVCIHLSWPVGIQSVVHGVRSRLFCEHKLALYLLRSILVLTFICLRATLPYDVAHRVVRSWRQNSFGCFSRWPWNTLRNRMCGVACSRMEWREAR
jgi:hypothetical protein